MKIIYTIKDTNGTVLFVGKSDYSAFNRCARPTSKRWKDYVGDSETILEVVAEVMTDEDAFDITTELYFKYKDTILNKYKPSKTKILPIEYIKEYLQYDESSPTYLSWKKRPNKSTANVGKQAGSLLNKSKTGAGKDYWQISLKGAVYKVHRVVWALFFGDADPSLVIDHVDGNGLNNNINNLRLVCQGANSTNKALDLNKIKSEPVIVEHDNIFITRFQHRGVSHKLRVRKEDYSTKEDAVEALRKKIEVSKNDDIMCELSVDRLDYKLTYSTRVDIYNKVKSGIKLSEVAREYNIGASSVHRIVKYFDKLHSIGEQ